MNRILSLMAALVLSAGPASAHVTLETATAAVGTTYEAVLRIPHGCGGKATDAVRVRIPEGVVAVKPTPKPGWKIDKVVAPYALEYQLHGRKVAEGVTEISWSGGSLADDEYDEFVFRGTLDGSLEAGKAIYFPVIQSCGQDAARWIEVPAEGQDAHELEFPAPALELTPGEHAGH